MFNRLYCLACFIIWNCIGINLLMSRANIRLMTMRVFQKFINRFGKNPYCQKCGNDMILDNHYVSMKSAHCSRAKSYHVSCAESVNITYD